MNNVSDYFADDYTRLSWSAQADRILMLKRMYEEKKQQPDLELPDFVFDLGTYPGDSACDYFFQCMNLLCNHWDIAELMDEGSLSNHEKTINNYEYLLMAVHFHFLSKLECDTELQRNNMMRIKEYIAEGFNEAGEYGSLITEWDKNNENILLIHIEYDYEYQSCLAQIIPLFRNLKKKMEEWT